MKVEITDRDPDKGLQIIISHITFTDAGDAATILGKILAALDTGEVVEDWHGKATGHL